MMLHSNNTYNGQKNEKWNCSLVAINAWCLLLERWRTSNSFTFFSIVYWIFTSIIIICKLIGSWWIANRISWTVWFRDCCRRSYYLYFMETERGRKRENWIFFSWPLYRNHVQMPTDCISYIIIAMKAFNFFSWGNVHNLFTTNSTAQAKREKNILFFLVIYE
jgi:hypothetical protein